LFTKSKSRQTILLDKELDLHVKKDSSVDIILSPTLYWVKKFKVPVGSNKEALKLLPSLFEEYLPSGEYSYFGYFEGDDFIGFAYDKKIILALLKEKGVELSQISSLRFAQSEFKGSYLPYALDENRVLLMQEGVVLIMPKIFAKEAKKINLQEISLSKYMVKNFEYYNSFIDTKLLSVFIIAMIVIVIFDSIAWYVTARESVKLEEKKEKIFQHYKLLPTTIQNVSLLKKYEKIYKKEKKLHKFFELLFQINLPKDVILENIFYNQKHIRVVFLHVKQPEKIIKQFSSFTIQKRAFSKNQLRLDIAA